MRSRLQDWVWRAGLCLALGLVTTVAVAWGLAAWLPHRYLWMMRSTGGSVPGMAHASLITIEGGRAGMLRRKCRVQAGREFVIDAEWVDDEVTHVRGEVSVQGPRWTSSWRPHDAPDGTAMDYERYEDARGWPWLSLWCELAYESGGVTAPGGVMLRDGPYFFDIRALPLRPAWRGLLANTGVYAIAWAGLLVVPGRLRRSRRRRRGWCVGCGYELSGLRPGVSCPECGASAGG